MKSARGWRLQPSAMDWVVLHFVLKGEGCIEIAGERIPLAPNMIVVTPSHSVKSIAGLGEVVRENGNAVWGRASPLVLAAGDACGSRARVVRQLQGREPSRCPRLKSFSPL